MNLSIPILVFTITVFCSCHSKQNKKIPIILKTEFEKIDDVKSISLLFEGSRTEGNHIVWPVEYQDLYYFKDLVSSDSLLHTSIDTILITGKLYFVILRTDKFEKDMKMDCHICTPVISIAGFERYGNTFKLLNFKKFVFQHGSFGEYGSISIDTLCQPVIRLQSGWTGTGAEMEFDKYFDIKDYSPIFTLTTFKSNQGFYDTNEAGYMETKNSIISRNDTSFIVETIVIQNNQLNNFSKEEYLERFWMPEKGVMEFKSERLKYLN